MMGVEEIRTRFERKMGQKIQIEKDIKDLKNTSVDLKKKLRANEKAKEVIRQVGLKTQDKLSFNISEVTSMALEAVLKNPYELKLEFVERRGKTDCDIYFVRDGVKIGPFDGGGGAVDIAAFALRVASWTMENPRSRNTLILDEPFKHLKGEKANVKVLGMVKEISEKLGLQIIMVSDERVSREATIEATDKLFETKIKKGITIIEEL